MKKTTRYCKLCGNPIVVYHDEVIDVHPECEMVDGNGIGEEEFECDLSCFPFVDETNEKKKGEKEK